MRYSVLSALAATCLVANGCIDDVLTGPAAEEAFVEARAATDALPEDVVIYLDDVVVGEDVLANLEPSRILRIEILKKSGSGRSGEAAGTSGNVIRIYTKPAASDGGS